MAGRVPRAYMETVDAGSHAEVSTLTLWLAARWAERWAANVRWELDWKVGAV